MIGVLNFIKANFLFFNVALLLLLNDESFHFLRRNFGFRWLAMRKRGAKCGLEKFRQISVKIGEKIAEKWMQAKNRRNLSKIVGHYNLSANFRFVSPIFFPIFREISRHFLPVQPAHRIQNLIMICRRRLCFLAWLKNRGFRVHEI